MTVIQNQEEFLSQREFARLSGKSPATVNKMVKSGELRTERIGSDVKIPYSELTRLMEHTLGRYKTKNILYLLPNCTEQELQEEISRIDADFEELRAAVKKQRESDVLLQIKRDYIEVPTRVDSISSLLDDLHKKTKARQDDAYIEGHYRAAIFKEFINRYTLAAEDYLSSVCCGRKRKDETVEDFLARRNAIRQLPACVLYDIIFFGEVRTEITSHFSLEEDMSGVADWIRMTNECMEAKFNAILKALDLMSLSKDGKTLVPMFKRRILTEKLLLGTKTDFLQTIGNVTVEDGKFFNFRHYTPDAQKIYEQVLGSLASTGLSFTVESTINEGIYMVLPVNTEADTSSICSLLNKGIFYEVRFLQFAEDAEKNTPIRLKYLLEDLKERREVCVKYKI